MSSEAGQSESDVSRDLTSALAGVNPLFLKKSGAVSSYICSFGNVQTWSNRSGAAALSATNTSFQARSHRGHISLIQPAVIGPMVNIKAVAHRLGGQAGVQVFAD